MGWFMREVVGDEMIPDKCEVWNRSALLSTFHICLVQNFSAQWREDMRKTPKVILGCLRGLGKK